MKFGKGKIVALLVCLLFAFSTISQTAATEIFSDDFDDGSISDWTIGQGVFIAFEHTASDYALYSDSSDTIGQWTWCSTPVMTEGTWSFDYYHKHYADSYVDFQFFINGTMIGNDMDGYLLEIRTESVEPSLRFIKTNQTVETLLAFWIFPDYFSDTWTHFDIIRDGSTGDMNVKVNGTSVMNATDTSFNRSEKFGFFNFKSGTLYNRVIVGIMLDNLVFTDEVPEDTTTSETAATTSDTTTDPGNPFALDPMLLIIGGGFAVVLIIVAFIVIKRK